MGLLVSWAAVALGLWLADRLVPNFELHGDWKSFVLIAAVVGVLHFLLGWLIYVILGIATLGLGFLFGFVTRLVASAIVLKIADTLSERFTIRGFVRALWGALLLSVTSGISDFVR